MPARKIILIESPHEGQIYVFYGGGFKDFDKLKTLI